MTFIVLHVQLVFFNKGLLSASDWFYGLHHIMNTEFTHLTLVSQAIFNEVKQGAVVTAKTTR